MSHSYKKIVFQLITKNSHTTEAGHRRASSTDVEINGQRLFFLSGGFYFFPRRV